MKNVTVEPEQQTSEIVELELVVSQTNELAVIDAERAQLVETLLPAANLIPQAREYAASLVVTNKAQADAAAAYRDTLTDAYSTAEKALREFSNGLIDRLFKTHRAWTGFIAKFKPLQDAAKQIKDKCIDYDLEQERLAAAETRRINAEREAEANRKEAALLKKAEEAKREETKERYREEAAAVPRQVLYVAPPPPSVKKQMRWVAEVESLPDFLNEVAATPMLHGLVTVELTKLARNKAANNTFQIKGIVFRQVAC